MPTDALNTLRIEAYEEPLQVDIVGSVDQPLFFDSAYQNHPVLLVSASTFDAWFPDYRIERLVVPDGAPDAWLEAQTFVQNTPATRLLDYHEERSNISGATSDAIQVFVALSALIFLLSLMNLFLVVSHRYSSWKPNYQTVVDLGVPTSQLSRLLRFEILSIFAFPALVTLVLALPVSYALYIIFSEATETLVFFHFPWVLVLGVIGVMVLAVYAALYPWIRSYLKGLER